MAQQKPHVLVLGGGFAGLGSAQQVREYAKDTVDITLINRFPYLIYIPNIPGEVFTNDNPMASMTFDLVKPCEKDDIRLVLGEVLAIDPDTRQVEYRPNERDGSAQRRIGYDYLVIALGNRLAFDRIEGFAQYGHTVTDTFHGEELRRYLKHHYRGGPIAIGSARFHQGDGAEGLAPRPGWRIPIAEAACEGPPVEVMLSMGTWLATHLKGKPSKATVFTPAKMIAEDAGEKVVEKLCRIASTLGFSHLNDTKDITRLTQEGIEFANGQSLEAEIKIIFPDWRAQDLLRDLPIVDSEGFVKTDLLMRNPKYPEVFAAGDAAAVTVPKLGAIGHQQTYIVGRQIAKDVGRLPADEADQPLVPEVLCIGDMGLKQGFYIHSNSWYGGDVQELKLGPIEYQLKMRYKTLFFKNNGKIPPWGLDAAKFIAEKIPG